MKTQNDNEPKKNPENTESAAGAGCPASPCSTFVRMFQPQFAPLVERGEKLQTVRKTPKRMPKRGDRLSLREWTGKPYRSKQRELRSATVESVHRITIEADEMWIDEVRSSATKMNAFARADGFRDYAHLLEWFQQTHALPFSGILICWSNDQVELPPKGGSESNSGAVGG